VDGPPNIPTCQRSNLQPLCDRQPAGACGVALLAPGLVALLAVGERRAIRVGYPAGAAQMVTKEPVQRASLAHCDASGASVVVLAHGRGCAYFLILVSVADVSDNRVVW